MESRREWIKTESYACEREGKSMKGSQGEGEEEEKSGKESLESKTEG